MYFFKKIQGRKTTGIENAEKKALIQERDYWN
jgi:hypothetical protein